MAINSLWAKAKDITKNTGNLVIQNSQERVLAKAIEEKLSNKSKLYGYIGMEVYDLHEAGKLDMEELQGYFDKLKVIDDEVKELQEQKQALELQAGKMTTCICGAQVTVADKFCPHCGAPVNNGMIVCACGNQVSKNTRFCNVCGRDLQKESGSAMMQPNVPPAAEAPAAVPMKQCICGAQVPEGQFMCMECGRKVE